MKEVSWAPLGEKVRDPANDPKVRKAELERKEHRKKVRAGRKANKKRQISRKGTK